MSPGAWIVAAILTLIVVAGTVAQIRAYRREGAVLTGSQLALRLVMGLLLLAIVVLVLYGARALATPHLGPTHAAALSAARRIAAFWTVVTVLLAVVMVLALLDLRHLRAAQRRARAAMYRNLAKLQEERRAPPSAPPDEPH